MREFSLSKKADKAIATTAGILRLASERFWEPCAIVEAAMTENGSPFTAHQPSSRAPMKIV